MSLVTTAIVDKSRCQYCGMIHGETCPRISAIEYHPNGQVKRVEFFDATGAIAQATAREGNIGGCGGYPEVLRFRPTTPGQSR